MNNRVAWALVLLGLAGGIDGSTAAEGQAKAPFADVPSGHADSAAVASLSERGLIFGYPDGTFRGNQPITRREVVEVLWRVVTLVERQLRRVSSSSVPAIPVVPPTGLGLFADVSPESSLADVLRDLSSRGIIEGYPGATFGPRRAVTQSELEVVLRRTLRWVEHQLSPVESRPGPK